MAAPAEKRGRGGAGARRSGRAALSRDAILQAALAVADREGLAGLTLRKIAAELGASPMGVYRHFHNKAEILGELVDLVITEREREADRQLASQVEVISDEEALKQEMARLTKEMDATEQKLAALKPRKVTMADVKEE